MKDEISQARLDTGRSEAMPYNISTLLTRNLDDVFGENDPVRRRAAIDEIFTEDCVFYEPKGCLPRPRRNVSDPRLHQGDSPCFPVSAPSRSRGVGQRWAGAVGLRPSR